MLRRLSVLAVCLGPLWATGVAQSDEVEIFPVVVNQLQVQETGRYHAVLILRNLRAATNTCHLRAIGNDGEPTVILYDQTDKSFKDELVFVLGPRETRAYDAFGEFDGWLELTGVDLSGLMPSLELFRLDVLCGISFTTFHPTFCYPPPPAHTLASAQMKPAIPAISIIGSALVNGQDSRAAYSFVNPSSDSTATIQLILYARDGSVFRSTSFDLGPRNKLAAFLDELFDDLGESPPVDIVTSILITSDIPVAVENLLLTAPNGQLWMQPRQSVDGP